MSAVFILQRMAFTPLSTSGRLSIGARTLCVTLEPGSSTPLHPRIPAGEYPLELRAEGAKYAEFRKSLGDAIAPGLPHIQVPGREWILAHPGNTIRDTEGCTLPGEQSVAPAHSASGEWEVAQSRRAFLRIYPLIRDAVAYGGAGWRVIDIGGA